MKARDIQLEHDQKVTYLKNCLNSYKHTPPFQLYNIEQEENATYRNKIEKVRYYEQGLETILDIKCSIVKPRQKREKIQDEMIEKLFSKDRDLSDIVTYAAVKDVASHDWHFCGLTKETNGKLRQLYGHNWKLQLELQKYKNIVNRVRDSVNK